MKIFLALFLLISSCAYSAVSVGDLAPEIEAKDWYNSNGSTLAELKNKIIVVEFWATWCGPCRESIPHLVALHKKYKDDGVVIIGLTNEDKVKEFVDKMKMTYIVGTGSSTGHKYGVYWIPHAFVIVEGKVVWDGQPEDGLENAIKKALKK